MTAYSGVLSTARVSNEEGKERQWRWEVTVLLAWTNWIIYFIIHFLQCFLEDKQQNRTFCVTWFKQKEWLTASVAKNALSPCLLFGRDTAWTQQGIVDLKHLSNKIKKHECSTSHSGCHSWNTCCSASLAATRDTTGVDFSDSVGHIFCHVAYLSFLHILFLLKKKHVPEKESNGVCVFGNKSFLWVLLYSVVVVHLLS